MSSKATRIVCTLGAVAFVAFCSTMGTYDKGDQSGDSDQRKPGMPTTYTGPNDKRAITAQQMDVLERHCPSVVAYLDRFSDLKASYIEMPDRVEFGDLAGGKMVMLSFVWKPGAWPKSVPHEHDALFIFIGGRERGITTGASGAWLCGARLPKGKNTVFLPDDHVSLSDR